MLTPPLHALDSRRLRPPEAAPTDAPAYTGEPWTVTFKEELIMDAMRNGPRVCIVITLNNRADGAANSTTNYQWSLAMSLTEKFGRAFARDERLEWTYDKEGSNHPWRHVCDQPTESYARWKFDARLPADQRKEQLGFNSWIPGRSTRDFLGLAFDMGLRLMPVTLAGREFTWMEKSGEGNQEGERVVWILTKPEGLQHLMGAGRRFLSGGGGY
tara:strand:- start:22 stop:663 length:642 start_codon:yes stop_codon:yes gene_type:complete